MNCSPNNLHLTCGTKPIGESSHQSIKLAVVKKQRVRAAGPDSSAIKRLCQRAQEGDERAFEALYRATVGPVYGLCLRMTANASIAEDCAQQAFIRAWQHLGEFRGEANFSTWLHRIAVNEVLAAARREGRYRDVMQEFANEAITGTQLQGSPTDSHDPDLEQAIAQLPQRARQVFVLHAVYGYQHDEAAQMLGMAVGTSKAHYHRARGLLRAALGDTDD